MKNKILYIALLVGTLSFGFFACEDKIDPIVEELELQRVLSPTGLTARVRNLTTIELTWITRADADHYVVEFSEDNLEFKTIIHSATVTAEQIPYQRAFDGETLYSARVKGVSADGVADSKWMAVSITTAQENIFLPLQDADIAATEATVRWPANSDVSHLVITPGNTERTITDSEKTAGAATVTGLTGETDYVVQLKKGTKHRGAVGFRTLIDLGNAIAVHPEDDLNAIVAAAQPGDAFVLFPGDYTVFIGNIVLNKAISLKGLYPNNKPKIHVQFSVEAGATEVELRDLDIDGDATLTDALRFNSAAVTYSALTISGCNIHDFARSLLAGNVASTVTAISIDNSVFTDILTSGGDFIDFRNTYVAGLTITNSTFDNCAPGRDFIRMDAAAGFTGTGKTANVSIDRCTLYGVSNNVTSTRRILYVRFVNNVLSVKNTLIAGSTGFYINQAATTQPTFLNNNYFNAQRFYDAAFEAPAIANLKIDNSGTHSTLDPGFTDAANGNFKLSDQTLKDKTIGDPRWLQ
ncbi:MAG TPA: DUF4957 domain-containing protein [Cyclobacteriaceae bacterium]|nr:DUF4957 domain-containing protein [Cyclobacteriaceae bacterium]